jgi:hypothetical protein
VVGCLPDGGIKKHTPGLGASLPIPFRASIAWAAMRPPFGCSTSFRSLSWFFPAFGRSRPALFSVMAKHSCAPFASLRSDGFIHFVRLASLQHNSFIRHYTSLRIRFA